MTEPGTGRLDTELDKIILLEVIEKGKPGRSLALTRLRSLIEDAPKGPLRDLFTRTLDANLKAGLLLDALAIDLRQELYPEEESWGFEFSCANPNISGIYGPYESRDDAEAACEKVQEALLATGMGDASADFFKMHRTTKRNLDSEPDLDDH